MNHSSIDNEERNYNGEGRNYPGFKLIHRKIIRLFASSNAITVYARRWHKFHRRATDVIPP